MSSLLLSLFGSASASLQKTHDNFFFSTLSVEENQSGTVYQRFGNQLYQMSTLFPANRSTNGYALAYDSNRQTTVLATQTTDDNGNSCLVLISQNVDTGENVEFVFQFEEYPSALAYVSNGIFALATENRELYYLDINSRAHEFLGELPDTVVGIIRGLVWNGSNLLAVTDESDQLYTINPNDLSTLGPILDLEDDNQDSIEACYGFARVNTDLYLVGEVNSTRKLFVFDSTSEGISTYNTIGEQELSTIAAGRSQNEFVLIGLDESTVTSLFVDTTDASTDDNYAFINAITRQGLSLAYHTEAGLFCLGTYNQDEDYVEVFTWDPITQDKDVITYPGIQAQVVSLSFSNGVLLLQTDDNVLYGLDLEGGSEQALLLESTYVGIIPISGSILALGNNGILYQLDEETGNVAASSPIQVGGDDIELGFGLTVANEELYALGSHDGGEKTYLYRLSLGDTITAEILNEFTSGEFYSLAAGPLSTEPIILSEPSAINNEFLFDEDSELELVVRSRTPETYQWQEFTLAGWVDIPDAVNDSYLVLAANGTKDYRCIITNTTGIKASSVFKMKRAGDGTNCLNAIQLEYTQTFEEYSFAKKWFRISIPSNNTSDYGYIITNAAYFLFSGDACQNLELLGWFEGNHVLEIQPNQTYYLNLQSVYTDLAMRDYVNAVITSQSEGGESPITLSVTINGNADNFAFQWYMESGDTAQVSAIFDGVINVVSADDVEVGDLLVTPAGEYMLVTEKETNTLSVVRGYGTEQFALNVNDVLEIYNPINGATSSSYNASTDTGANFICVVSDDVEQDATTPIFVDQEEEPEGIVVANQTAEFGRYTLIGAGKWYPEVTNGVITEATLSQDDQSNPNHWQVNSDGSLQSLVTPLSMDGYELEVDFGGESPTTITIDVLDNRYSVVTAAEFDAIRAINTATLNGRGICVRRSPEPIIPINRFRLKSFDENRFIITSHPQDIVDGDLEQHSKWGWFRNLQVETCTNIDVQYLEFHRNEVPATNSNLLAIMGSVTGTFTYNVIHGKYHDPLADYSEGGPRTMLGIVSQFIGENAPIDIDISNNHIYDVSKGMTVFCMDDQGGMRIEGNYVHHCYEDCITLGRGWPIIIRDNVCHTGFGMGTDAGNPHSDYLQFTAVGIEREACVIERNVFYRGISRTGAQGMLLRDASDNPPNGMFSNFRIAGNLVILKHTIGIWVNKIRNGQLFGNTVVKCNPVDSDAFTVFISIGRDNLAPHRKIEGRPYIFNNVSEGILVSDPNNHSLAEMAGNLEIGYNGSLVPYPSLFVDPTLIVDDRDETIAAYTSLPNSPLDADNSGTPTIGDIGSNGSGYATFSTIHPGVEGAAIDTDYEPPVCVISPINLEFLPDSLEVGNEVYDFEDAVSSPTAVTYVIESGNDDNYFEIDGHLLKVASGPVPDDTYNLTISATNLAYSILFEIEIFVGEPIIPDEIIVENQTAEFGRYTRFQAGRWYPVVTQGIVINATLVQDDQSNPNHWQVNTDGSIFPKIAPPLSLDGYTLEIDFGGETTTIITIDVLDDRYSVSTSTEFDDIRALSTATLEGRGVLIRRPKDGVPIDPPIDFRLKPFTTSFLMSSHPSDIQLGREHWGLMRRVVIEASTNITIKNLEFYNPNEDSTFLVRFEGDASNCTLTECYLHGKEFDLNGDYSVTPPANPTGVNTGAVGGLFPINLTITKNEFEWVNRGFQLTANGNVEISGNIIRYSYGSGIAITRAADLKIKYNTISHLFSLSSDTGAPHGDFIRVTGKGSDWPGIEIEGNVCWFGNTRGEGGGIFFLENAAGAHFVNPLIRGNIILVKRSATGISVNRIRNGRILGNTVVKQERGLDGATATNINIGANVIDGCPEIRKNVSEAFTTRSGQHHDNMNVVLGLNGGTISYTTAFDNPLVPVTRDNVFDYYVAEPMGPLDLDNSGTGTPGDIGALSGYVVHAEELDIGELDLEYEVPYPLSCGAFTVQISVGISTGGTVFDFGENISSDTTLSFNIVSGNSAGYFVFDGSVLERSATAGLTTGNYNLSINVTNAAGTIPVTLAITVV